MELGVGVAVVGGVSLEHSNIYSVITSTAQHAFTRAYTHTGTHTDEDLPTFPVDPSYLKPIRVRVRLAKRIDSQEHKERKSKKSNDWLIQSAKAMDIELDKDMYPPFYLGKNC